MSFNYAGGRPYKAVTLAFFSGIIEILCGILNLGFLIQYISQPVVTAFSSAVCIQVNNNLWVKKSFQFPVTYVNRR